MSEAIRRVSRRDLIIAVVVAVIELGITSGSLAHHGGARDHACLWHSCHNHGLNGWAYLLLFAGAAALTARRIAPRAVLLFAFATTVVYTSAGFPIGPNFLALLIAYGTVVIAGYRTLAWAVAVGAWGLLLWLPGLFTPGRTPSLAEAVGFGAWLLVITFAAEIVRARHDRNHAQRRARRAEGERRAEEERLRIARELHDVLAHNISLINVQSGVALHLLDQRPEQARSALSIINEASADALREMRSVLGVLRGVDEDAPRRPAAGLDRLEDLIAGAGAAGVEVQTQTAGAPRMLAVPVDLAAYRIVQESLTNVARHGGARAMVSLRYGADALDVEIDDEGAVDGSPGSPVNGTGNGITGMRERAVALGGELRAGPRRDGAGFSVRARLPYGGGA